MGYDDMRDRALFEESAMSQQPTVSDRLRWLLQTFKIRKISVFMPSMKRGWNRIRMGGMCGARG
ncbi:hypothetical protein ACLK2H_24700 [Escherichia coli]